MTPCSKCGSIHLYSTPCVKPQDVVKQPLVVKHPVENVVKQVVKQDVVKRKDRHLRTAKRVEYLRTYMREYMRKRRASGV